jgi:haloalkane dehalogenase
MAWVQDGPDTADPVLMLHGEPSWSVSAAPTNRFGVKTTATRATSNGFVTLVGQDWGGLIGLRLAAEHPDHFARIVVANTS